MKKSLLWSLMTTAAIMTACGDDALVENQQVLQGEETPIAFKIDLGQTISTYATDMHVGGWTNWLNGEGHMGTDFNARAVLQVYAEGQTTPYTQVRTVIEPDEVANNTIALPNFNLPSGNNYTAVVWVDFVPSTTKYSTIDNRHDFFWNTANLANVQEEKIADNMLNLAGNNPESRDAYTGKINFTVNKDGSYNTEEDTPQIGAPTINGTNIPAINIEAQRKFAKVSLVLTDYNKKSLWLDAFKNLSESDILNYINMQVKDMSRGYNALTQKPIVDSQVTTNFHRGFNALGTSIDDVNDIQWIKEGHNEYPIFDLNYIIPANADKVAATAIYNIRFKGYNAYAETGVGAFDAANAVVGDARSANGYELITNRGASNIPVRTNAHTIIKMNMYKTYSFEVTVNDLFTGGKENVTVDGDDAEDENILIKDDHYIPALPDGDVKRAHVVIKRNTDNVATSIIITNVNDYNFDAVIDDLASMVNLSDDSSNPAIHLIGTNLPNPASFADLKDHVTNDIHLSLKGTEGNAGDVILTGLNNNITLWLPTVGNFQVTSEANVTIKKVVSGAYPTLVNAKNATFEGTTYNSVTANVKENATFNGGVYNNAPVTVTGAEGATNPAAIINGGTFNHNFISYVNTTINGGTLPYVKTSDTNNKPLYSFIMSGAVAHTLYVNKTSSIFGPLDAAPQNIHSVVFNSETIFDLYKGGWVSNFLSSSYN